MKRVLLRVAKLQKNIYLQKAQAYNLNWLEFWTKDDDTMVEADLI